jgi:IS30 family transposase
MNLRSDVKKFIKEAQSRMRLEHWEINLVILQDCTEETLMTVAPDTEYLHATLTLYEKNAKKEIKRFSIEEIRKAVYHEMAHITTFELVQLASARYIRKGEIDDAWERAAENISRAVLNSPKQLEEKSTNK